MTHLHSDDALRRPVLPLLKKLAVLKHWHTFTAIERHEVFLSL